MLDRNFDRASFGYWNKNAVIPFYLLSLSKIHTYSYTPILKKDYLTHLSVISKYEKELFKQ